MNFFKKNFLILLIILVALVLRVYNIAQYPAGLNADEAAIGYNAYSLLKTGKDEFGHPWPINFQSFNDYKPGLYFYLVMPFVKVLGLNEVSVRLPSAILGTLTVLLVYFLVSRIFKDKSWSLISSFLLAISPWHLHFSRGGWESNTAVFFIVLGVYLFYLSLERPKYLVFSAASFLLSMYTYHSARLLSPLMVVILLIVNKKIFSKNYWKWGIVTLAAGLVFSLPLLYSLRGQAGISRFSGVGIFADQGPFWRINELRGQHLNPYGIEPKLLHNKVVEYSLLFFKNYLKHFDGNFLFISGDEIERNKVPETGQMYLAEIPFLILGLYFLLSKKPKNWPMILWWLLIAPVASALTFQSPHAIRSLSMIIPLTMISGYGIYQVFYEIKKRAKKWQFLALPLVCMVYLYFFINYLHQYYVHYPQIYPAAWEYGFEQLVNYVSAKEDNFDRIFVTNKYDQPYILFAFYLQYPPEKFQNEAKLTVRDQYGFSTVDSFGKYVFGPINFQEINPKSSVMIIGTPQEIPDSGKIDRRIYFMDGKSEAFRISEYE